MRLKSSFYILIVVCLVSLNAKAQSLVDTTTLIITNTRTPQKLYNATVPTTIITQQQIQQLGTLKASDILKEQTGLVIQNNFGQGIQMMGLSPEYTLILIDGEPLIGRNGGTLDLSRIVLANIERIEIVKGPFSSLYGNEALGGVINIITKKVKTNFIQAQLRYGSNQTFNANVLWQKQIKNTQHSFFVDRNSSAGYSFNSNQVGQTADPFQANTAQWQISFNKNKWSLKNSIRAFNETQQNKFDAGGSAGIVAGDRQRIEFNISPTIGYKINNKLTSDLRLYYTYWSAEQLLNQQSTNTLYYNDNFKQQFLRAEQQWNYTFTPNHEINFGYGVAADILKTNRYNNTKYNANQYLFVQQQWKILANLNVVNGIRIDNNNAFKTSINPKTSIRYALNQKVSFTGSIGTAFKAPDFRQMYLNFNNDVAGGGYTVYGANETSINLLEQQLQQGLLQSLLPKAYSLQQLNPETAISYQIGGNIQFNKKIKTSWHVFRNDIKNLIEFDVVALKANNGLVYSYFNKNSAFTQGLTLDVDYLLNKNFTLIGGYQYLITADKNALEQIKNQTVYTRNTDGAPARLLERSEYIGLANRSKHTAQLKLIYTNVGKGLNISARAIYRNQWGIIDRDGNGILNTNRKDEMATGYVSSHIAITKSIKKIVQLSAGIDNIGNYRDAINLPNIPGRTYFIRLQLNN
jgi:outer membrane receptor for ferrienterochelin and colicins